MQTRPGTDITLFQFRWSKTGCSRLGKPLNSVQPLTVFKLTTVFYFLGTPVNIGPLLHTPILKSLDLTQSI